MTRFYRFIRAIIRFIVRVCGLRVEGQENIPQEGRRLVIANHASLLDPVLLIAAFPYQIHFVAKAEFARNFFIRRLFSALGVVFIKRAAADLLALRSALAIIASEKTLGIFPEGQRFRDGGLTEFKPGTAFIAYKGGATLVPVGIRNAQNALKFWRRNTVVVIGRPFELKPDTSGSEIADNQTSKPDMQKMLKEHTDTLKHSIESLL